ncbi:hypothetical protein ACF0H5_017710 [Mactra antiquata]
MNKVSRYTLYIVIAYYINYGLSISSAFSQEMAKEENNIHTTSLLALYDNKVNISNISVPNKSSAVLGNYTYNDYTDINKSMSQNLKYDRKVINLLKRRKAKTIPSDRKRLKLFKKCYHRTKSVRICLSFNLFIHPSYNPGRFNMKSFYQRKLLSIVDTNSLTKHPENESDNESDINGNNSVQGNSTENLLDDLALEEYEELVKAFRQSFSKDPLRAMISVSVLMMILMVAIKCCGMKPIKHQKEIPPEYDGAVHYVSIYEILKMRRPYLPKKLLRWERRIRRKLKRKKRIMKERDLAEPHSDNSDEETLIYSQNCDF